MRTRSVASSALLLLTAFMVLGCRSTRDTSGRMMYDFFPHDPEKVERILEKTKSGGSEEQLIALASASGPSKRKLRALRDETIESYEAGGPASAGVLAAPAPQQFSVQDPASEAALSTPEVCEDRFCAGVASRSLDPFLWDPPLPRKPSSWFPRLFTGASQPPLAGYFRLRPFIPGSVFRYAFHKNYYAHWFKDSQGTAPGGPTIQVKALALRGENGEKVIWAKADLIGAFQDLRQAVIDRLRDKRMTLEQGQLLLHGTHTHSGLGALNPRLFPEIATVDRFSRPLFNTVADRIAEAILAAEEDLQPARIGVGMAERSDLTRNRRPTCTTKGDQPSPNPDPTIGILRIDRADNNAPLATVFNFAIHGTSLNDDNLLLSPDNMGWAEWFIEQKIGGMALFFNGAQGDIMPKSSSDDRGPLDEEEYIGKQLSETVVAKREDIVTTDKVRLYWEHCHLDQPDRPDEKGCPAEFELENFQLRLKMVLPDRESCESVEDCLCYVDRGHGKWVISISKQKDPPKVEREGAVLGAFLIVTGPESQATRTLVMTMPGEPIRDIGMLMKANAPAGVDNTWVFGLSNAHIGYIVTEEEYMQGGYEAMANFFGPTQGERLTSIAAYLAAKVFQ